METCDWCDGRGWALVEREHTGMFEVQRCDECEIFTCDHDAGEAALKALERSGLASTMILEQ